jgi:hypothetical protein
MARNSTRRKLGGVGVFILPVIIVKATGVLLTPAGVSAFDGAGISGANGTQAGLHGGAHKFSKRQLAAARYVKELAGESFGESPLYYDPNRPVIEDTTITTDPVTNDPVFKVTAVMNAGETDLALIDGELLEEGDTLRHGRWEVTLIDQDTRSVTFAEVDGDKTLTQYVPLPE